MQLVHVGVLASDFADLAADRHRDACRLLTPDERGEIRRERHVDLLLLVEGRLVEIDERRRVDIDVVEPGGDLFLDERPQRVQLLVAIGAVELLRVGLHVVALDEDGPAEPLAKRRREHDRGVLVRALLRVANLRARDLEDEGAGIELLRRADDRARGVVRHRAHVDRGHREPARLAAAHRDVQIVNRCRPDARGRSERPHRPSGSTPDLGVGAEGRGPRQLVDNVARRRARHVDVLHLLHGLIHKGSSFNSSQPPILAPGI